ncbi:MAG TPA: cytochrome P450 [Solirubrobacteraceae bacterium]|nr:cytochrome P450 [Solirubrobacteraceae bacterium]
MTRVDELELPYFDYTDAALRGERFHAAMLALREQGWLASGPLGYIVLDREAAEHFLRTRDAVFPGMKIAEIFEVSEGPLWEEMRRNILHLNGPDHSRLRKLVNPALAPRAVQRYRPPLRELLGELFSDITGPGGVSPEDAAGVRECEFVQALAKPYPSRAIAYVMGVPAADAPRLHHWSNWIQRQFDAISMATERPAIEAAVAEFYEYAWELLRARRAQPGDDLISALIAASEPDVASLSDVECVNLVLNVLIGGVDTTQSQLAHALRLFAEHPDQWELLARRPELVPTAVEEALRFEPITPFTARIVEREIVFRDVVFPVGTIVMVCAFTANRDLSAADGETEPGADGADTFDILAAERRSAGSSSRVLTFGAGVHYCLGANLARVELEEALAFLAPRMPGLELAGEPVFEGITGIYGLAELPLRFAV